MKLMIALGILFFSLIFFSSATVATGSTGMIITHPGGGGGSQQNNTIGTLQPPVINFTPLKYPSFKSYNWSWNIIQDMENLWDWITGGFIVTLLDWVGVFIANAILYLVQAVYYFLAYIQYFILLAIVNTSSSLGIFSLPVFLIIFVLIGVTIYVLISVGRDATIIGALE